MCAKIDFAPSAIMPKPVFYCAISQSDNCRPIIPIHTLSCVRAFDRRPDNLAIHYRLYARSRRQSPQLFGARAEHQPSAHVPMQLSARFCNRAQSEWIGTWLPLCARHAHTAVPNCAAALQRTYQYESIGRILTGTGHEANINTSGPLCGRELSPRRARDQ